jgi:hypothetical protein
MVENLTSSMKERDGGDDGNEDMVDVRIMKKQKVDPLVTVKRAISHPAYAMLKVVD